MARRRKRKQQPVSPKYESFSSVPRKEVAPLLREALKPYFAKQGASLHFEVGVERGGSLRADVIALTMKRKLTVVEVKSGWQDFAADRKWQRYLSACHQFYFCFTDTLWNSHADRIRDVIAGSGAGVIVVGMNGSVRKVLPAPKRPMDVFRKLWIITKLAWIGGFSQAVRKN